LDAAVSWKIDDRKLKAKVLRSMPRNVQAKWTLWTEIVVEEGPDAPVNYPGFKDEDLEGD
jgi:hypothetical protein